MKKSLIFILLSYFLILSNTAQAQPTGDQKKFETMWSKVDSLERKGLYRMAMTEVDKIFEYASDKINHNQVIKSVLYELKFNAYMEEDDYVLGISRLDELIVKAPSPSKEILHSLTAEVYWGYYSSNQWKFQDRTHVGEVDLKDIRTWDLKRIAEKVRYHYLMSMMNADKSKTEKIKDFAEIASYTENLSTQAMRPTLFDFLGHRALDFFKHNTFNVPGSAETFVIDNRKYFGANTTFLSATQNIVTADSLNTKFFAMRLFYELTKFHQEQNNRNALFSIELERVQFIRDNINIDEKQDLYYSSLERLAQAYQNDDYSSEAWYEIALFHSNKASSYNFLADTSGRWEYNVSLEVCKKTIAKFPAVYGSQQCEVLQAQIKAKSLNLMGEQAIPSDEESRFRLEYRNVNKFYYKIVPYDYKKVNSGKNDWNKMIKYLRKTKGVYNEELSLNDPKDHQIHSTEIVVPKLKNGYYYIVVGSNPNFLESGHGFSFMPIWVTNLTYQIRDDNGSQNVLVTNRSTGQPINTAKAQVTYQKYNYVLRMYERKTLGNFITDENGEFNFKPKEDYYNYYVTLNHEGEVYAPNGGHYAYRYNGYQQPIVTRLFTDRTIYRPGQTVHYKGIVTTKSGEKRDLKKDYKTTVYFYDVNSQEIAHEEVTTNKFGSFQGTFTAPFGVLTGQMRIQEAHGNQYFRVEEYKRPKFNVEMKPIEGEFQLNDKIEATGVAKAFAGNFIDGAEVKYRVTRSTTYYGWYYWWYWRPYEAPKEITQGELTTDENGEFVIPFNAVPDKSANPKDLPVFTYTIYADVTDINGETHSTSTSVMVGYQSLQLSNNLKSDINGQDDFVLRISTTNLNGQDIDAKGGVIVEKLDSPKNPLYNRLWAQTDLPILSEKEFKAKFPNHVYKDENNHYNWGIEKEVFSTSFDTKITDSVQVQGLNLWDPGMYKYTAVAKDKNGIEITDVFYFTLFNPAGTKAPTNEVLWLKELKTFAEPGDKVSVLLGTAEEDLVVRYDIEVKNKIVESKHFTLSKEQKKLDFTVKEEHRGNFTVHFSAVKNNRKFGRSVTVTVPYTNKRLDLEFSTFRDKLLPGSDEEWTLTIKNAKGEEEMAELLATLYDASLDQLYTPNSFYLNVWQSYYGNKARQHPMGMSTTYANNYHHDWNPYKYYPSRYLPTLNYHGFNSYYYGRHYGYYDYDSFSDYGADMLISEDSEGEVMNGAPMMDVSKSKDSGNRRDSNGNAQTITGSLPMGGAGTGENQKKELESKSGKLDASLKNLPDELEQDNVDLSGVKARSNFNETAFFFPQLTSDENGDVKIKFTIPESLTKWKFVGLAHTQDLKIGTISEEVVTQKDLMVVPNAPRFLREGDKITLSTKISNISDKDLEGAVQLDLIDPFTEKEIDGKFEHKEKQLPFKVEAGKSTSVSWTIDVPYETAAVKYRFVAAAGDFSDGEENVLPILSNRMLVTESMPMPIRGNQTKDFKFKKLIDNKSKTLKHHRYTLEFTSNPAWYALQAMPYMMEYPYECAEQTFTRYYSNAIATHIMNSNPKIQKVIEDWGKNSPEAFLSNLQKNQELKSLMLEETPWVLNAKSEEQTKKNLSILLDLNRMSKELDKALGKTIKTQSANGGWPWFPGMKESRYITQHIITGMGHLDHLGIKDIREDRRVWNMIKKGVEYLDGEIRKDYRSAKKYDPNYLTNQHIGYTQVQYLYARSYFPGINMNKNTQEAVGYYKDQAVKFWLNFNIYAEGMLALAAHRFEMKDLATDIVKSLKDRSIHSEEFGMYWKDHYVGYYWYEAPIETQALMIEMFDEVTNDQESVEELKIWLLKEKQTTHWKTTKQTSEAVYALLLKGSDLLASDELVELNVGGDKIEYVEEADEKDPYKVKAEAGTGYFKTAWDGNKVKSNMGNITATKKDDGIAWGAAYWQYFEDLDKITFAETNLKLQKDLFVINLTKEGEELLPVNENHVLTVGQKVRVRIELRTDRNLEYVHMKDMRASGFEPINVLSRYKYQDGLGYYQATKDAATNFFFDYIPKGTYVFEYDLRVQHKGNFSNGITTIQCMYAPEFTSHSEGIRVNVK